MNTVIEIENLKCSGCANSITKALLAIEGVDEIVIDHDSQSVEITAADDFNMEVCINKLALLGYPKKGEGNQFQKMKSYVSCAVGKVN